MGRDILIAAIPFFLATIFLEAWASKRYQPGNYVARDSVASITLGVGNLILSSLAAALFLGALYTFLYEHRLFTMPRTWWAYGLLFLGEDLCYYWYHRWAHEKRFWWAAHEVHHSSEHYNLSTAVRQSWTTMPIIWVFWAPLLLLGFDPVLVGIQQAISLIYQYWIHTRLIGRMGPLEWVLNTPSHHRVHHGINVQYLDKNYGGILIIWDRLFGTFEPEGEEVRYGVLKQVGTYNLFFLAFHVWRDIIRDVLAAPDWRSRWMYVFGPPGWRHDGTGVTVPEMQAAHQSRRVSPPPDGGAALPT